MGENEKKYFVWRITTDWNEFALLHKELMKNHILRQGWGLDGMRVDKTFADFHAAWPKSWGDEAACRKRFNILYPMTEIQEGDFIVIPKVDMKCDHPRNAFTVARCIGTYKFEPFDRKISDDFGHCISVEVLLSCDNEGNNESKVIQRKFRAYQRAINRVQACDFIEAVDNLIKMQNEGKSNYFNERSPMDILSEECKRAREGYLKTILGVINRWNGNSFERIIQSVFERNGYIMIGKNQFDGQGGDVDLVFKCFTEKSLMDSLFSNAECDRPDICIQAKNKSDQDYDDVKGIEQLVKMRDRYVSPILILINTEHDFTREAREQADSNGVILLNGMAFADLLVRYGLA